MQTHQQLGAVVTQDYSVPGQYMAGAHGRAGRAMALPLFPGSLYRLASSARNTVRCLKPNGLGTRPRSSIPLRVCAYYVRERNLSKEEAHGGPGTCNPRTSGTCSAKREGATRAHPKKRKMKAKTFFRTSRGLIGATRLYICTASGSV